MQINAMPPSLDGETLHRLREVETATVGHFRDTGFMHPRIRAFIGDVRIVGTAVTVRIYGHDTSILSYALGLVRPGDVLVVDRGGEDTRASWGAVSSTAAREAGLAGAILDGRVADPQDIRAVGLPVWATGVSPILGRSLGREGAFNAVVSCGGVIVHPGDAIIADESGVLVLRPDEVPAVIEEALARQAKEQTTLARLRAGERMPDISGARERVERAAAAARGEG